MYKRPLILRLMQVEKWRRARFERALERGDQAAGIKAAMRYEEVSARANAAAFSEITPYRDF